MKYKNRNNINEVGLVPDLAFMSPMIYLFIIIMGIGLIPIEIRKKFIRNILKDSFIKNSDMEINRKQENALESYSNSIVHDLSTNVEINSLIKNYQSFFTQKNDLDLEYKNNFIPKFKIEVKWKGVEPSFKDVDNFFSNIKNTLDFKNLYKRHMDYKMDMKNIESTLDRLLNRDFYKIIRKVISDDKYVAFDEILSALNKDATPSELKAIKNRYLKNIITKSKEFLQNQINSNTHIDKNISMDDGSSKFSPEWLVNILSFSAPNPSE